MTWQAPVPEIPALELDTLESLFHGADTNADGVVDFHEFKVHPLPPYHPVPLPPCHTASSTSTSSRASRYLSRVHSPRGATWQGVMELLAASTGKRYNTLQLRGLFRMADLDGSGRSAACPPLLTSP